MARNHACRLKAFTVKDRDTGNHVRSRTLRKNYKSIFCTSPVWWPSQQASISHGYLHRPQKTLRTDDEQNYYKVLTGWKQQPYLAKLLKATADNSNKSPWDSIFQEWSVADHHLKNTLGVKMQMSGLYFQIHWTQVSGGRVGPGICILNKTLP